MDLNNDVLLLSSFYCTIGTVDNLISDHLHSTVPLPCFLRTPPPILPPPPLLRPPPPTLHPPLPLPPTPSTSPCTLYLLYVGLPTPPSLPPPNPLQPHLTPPHSPISSFTSSAIYIFSFHRRRLWGRGTCLPITEKRLCIHKLLSPLASPNSLVFPNIFDKSTVYANVSFTYSSSSSNSSFTLSP